MTPVHAHASGRPWVLGRLPGEGEFSPYGRALLAEAGDTRLLLVGWFSVTPAELTAMAARVGAVADLDAVASSLSGSFHLIASVRGRVRVQGSLAGVRRVAYGRLTGVDVAADRADVLADVIGSEVDDSALAARMLAMVPAALSIPMWRGIPVLAPDSYLVLDRDGRARPVRWWTPPEPVGSLRDGAVKLYEALTGAVAARVVPGRTVATDLSGGLDSTPVSFLTKRAVEPTGGSLVTFRMAVADGTHDDHTWAGRAQEALGGGMTHRVIAPDAMPAMFDGIATPVSGLDEPLRWLRTCARLRHVARVLAETGALAHLTGHGGDEIVAVKPTYLHELVTSRPRLALRHLSGLRALKRWSLPASLRALADRASYPAWLAAEIRRLTEPFPKRNAPMLGWEYPLRLPPWASRHAAELVAATVRDRLADTEPYAPARWAHLALDLVRTTGSAVRQGQDLTARAGATLHAPYLDDRVIEACLSVAVHERASPWSYKPLMVAAMRDHMPPGLLTRATKGEFSDELRRGLSRHRDQVGALVEAPLLARRGLVDDAALRRAALDLYPPGQPWGSLDGTLAAENWLRAGQPLSAISTERTYDHDVLAT